MVEFDTRIQFLKGVGETRAKQLNKLGIYSIGALLRYYPKRYEDWNTVTEIRDVKLNETTCIKATVAERVSEVRVKSGKLLTKTTISDMSGFMPIVFFNNRYVKNTLKENEEYLFFGKVTLDAYKNKTMLSPRFEIAGEKQRLRPIYRASGNLTSKNIEKLVETALKEIKGNVEEVLPQSLISKYKLMSLEDAIRNIHFPQSEELLRQAKRRLIFEELLILQLGLLSKKSFTDKRETIPFKIDKSEEFYNKLPFVPTNAQKKAVSEAIADLMSEKPMNRLVQGDVGSGKTAVAAAIIYTAVKNGFQAAFMAPTEVLASQHFKTLKSFFGEEIKTELLTGSLSAKNKREIKQRIELGECQVVVGTHAMIQSDVIFNSLGLVITDEQHRFGVAQRTALSQKGENTNVLVMSATPIPRTLAMVIYGDLDVSVLDELPKGRLPIKTYRVNSAYHERLYDFLRKTIDKGQQAYIVCPLVEESESDLIPATEYYDYLKTNQFSDYTLGLLHGQMKPKEKDEVMARFYSGEINLLISTVVIEVGVDVPNATVMVIENAERFGLSQLHQLRGRIGRGKEQSTCVLLSDAQNEEAMNRFQVLCDTNDGFVIAQKDLELRGPGDFFGSRQHGLPDMHIANLMTDTRILYEAQKTAKEICDDDTTLSKDENKTLKKEVERLFANVSLT
ncbi:MAG: ATP-dependent DNA helicase RecG [Clostridia bacterium]|nr:ATP-dependent DNA helicase RecG [Clostridia bacterium]